VSLRLSALALMIATLSASNAASAGVLEIGQDGEVTVHEGPRMFTADGAAPIRPPTPPKSAPLRAAPSHVAAHLARAGQAQALDPALLEAIAWVESRYNQDARSPKGAIGLMQLMPGTARDLGVDPYDAGQNAAGGAAYLRYLLTRFNGDLTLTLAAYNVGPEAVRRFGGVPPFRETQAYVAAVLERLASIEESRGSTME